MLVIAIMGIMATFLIPLYRDRMENFKIDKTALQIQQVLQAGTSYWMQNNHKWPGKKGVCAANKTFNDNYVPMDGLMDPWGGNICYAPANANLFQVTAVASNEHYATQVASRLPNAKADYNNAHQPIVIAEVAAPGTTGSQLQGYLIKQIGSFTSGNTPLINFTCPTGWTGNVATSIDTALIPLQKTKKQISVEQLQPATMPATACLQGNADDQHSCRIATIMTVIPTTVKHDKVAISYIAYCIPPKQKLTLLPAGY